MNKRTIVVLLFLGITLSASGCLAVHRAPPYMKEVQRVRSAYIKKMESRYDLSVFGSGGALMTDVKGIFIYFQAPYNATIPEARSLAVAMTQELLHDINSDKDLRAYLHNYPFTPANLQLGVDFAPRNPLDPLSVDGITVSKDRIKYLIIGANNAFECIYQESYEEALDKVGDSLESSQTD